MTVRPSASADCAGGPSYDGIGKWLAILALYDVTFLLVGYAVYDFLLED